MNAVRYRPRNESTVVYDASTLLAVVFDEPGSDSVIDYLAHPDGKVSAVNWSEVGAKLAERGLQEKELVHELAAFAHTGGAAAIAAQGCSTCVVIVLAVWDGAVETRATSSSSVSARALVCRR
ncbi:PIN domain-containing protein [Nitrococcus mobilis]|uniref:hypothetical protein n=1 Tax=Nitrococcus mobilis TaxID=35797 RepID=UPI0003225B95|nr:hypothetical protein [Nitrococcus mobilis]